MEQYCWHWWQLVPYWWPSLQEEEIQGMQEATLRESSNLANAGGDVDHPSCSQAYAIAVGRRTTNEMNRE